MTGTFNDDGVEHLLLPGFAADYLETEVHGADNKALMNELQTTEQALRDKVALPTTDAREGYFGPRHFEYWLSGLRDLRKVISATNLESLDAPHVLDFGGASGRFIRHLPEWRPSSRLYLCDINPQHILLAKRIFGPRVTALRSRGVPTLPFPDASLDCVVAFSVFTHIDSEDTAWLLELRRIVKPGGFVYLTIHDQATWETLRNTIIRDLCFSNENFRMYYDATPSLTGRKVHTYNNADDYQCNVFHGTDYIDNYWAPLFRKYTIYPLAHDHQSGISLQV